MNFVMLCQFFPNLDYIRKSSRMGKTLLLPNLILLIPYTESSTQTELLLFKAGISK